MIARHLSCGDQTVRNAIHAFNLRGLAALQRGSTVAQHLPHTAFDTAGLEHLPILIKRSPRTFGKPTSIWTLAVLAEVCFAEGLTPRQVSGETLRATLKRLGSAWKRAKRWIRSPDPAYTPKKSVATGYSAWQPGIRVGRWALATRSGGAASPRLTVTPGSRMTHPCDWLSRKAPKMMLIPRRWPAMGCWCVSRHLIHRLPPPSACCCGLSPGVRSAA